MYISCVIPTYKEGDYLFDTLSYLSQQTGINQCEVIFADFDPYGERNTYDTLNQFMSTYPQLKESMKFKVVDVPRRGIGFARNVGVSQARGDIICNVDADSHYSTNDGLSRMTDPIVTGEAVMTIPWNFYYDGNPIVDTSVAVSNLVQYVHPFHLTGSCILKSVVIASGGFSDENTSDELGKITGYVSQNGLPLQIVSSTHLIKSARRVTALVNDPLNIPNNIKNFGVAYR